MNPPNPHASLADDRNTTFLIRWRGKQEGPYTAATIEAKLAANQIGLLHEICVGNQWMTIRERQKAIAARRQAELEAAEQARKQLEAQAGRSTSHTEASSNQPEPPRYHAPASLPRGGGYFKYAALTCGGVIAALLLVVVIILLTRDNIVTVPGGDGGAAVPAHQQQQQQAQIRSAMESVMATDRQMDNRMRSNISSGTSPIQAITSYASGLKGMDMSRCPPEFREAYVRHANAWEGLAIQMAKEPQSFPEGVFMGFLNGLGGEADGGVGRWQHARDARLEAIRTTWDEVEAIAVRYGAKL